MRKVQIAVLTVFAAFGTIECTVPLAGKCNTENTVAVPLPIEKMEIVLKWKVVYATHLNPIEDHEYYLASLQGGHNYKTTIVKVLKDNTKRKFVYREKYINNVLIGDFEDENGTPNRFYMYPLLVTKSYAILLYRCSDTGDTDLYYRFIVAPADGVTSESEIQQLLDFDRATFGDKHGALVKLPEKIPE